MNFRKILELEDINITDKMMEQFSIYFEELIKKNEVMNLTAITDEQGVYFKHFFDSIMVSKAFDKKNVHLLDVGSGAGFPSIPLKIVFPELKITIVDSLNKRINFLQELVQKLGIDNVELHAIRIEDFKEREKFDVVTARAVSKLNILAELCLPFTKVHGVFISTKGINYEEEFKAALPGIKLLGGVVDGIIKYDVLDRTSVLIKIKKVEKTNSLYPRSFSKIKSNPL